MNNCAFVVLAFLNLFAKQPPYEKFSDEIREQHRKEILEPLKMRFSILGGGNDAGIKTIHLGVSTKGPGSIEESRKLLIFLVEDLLLRYNTHQKIRPYLSNYPYTTDNLTYKIWYQNPKGTFWIAQDDQNPDTEIAHVGMYRGKINYSIVHENSHQLETLYTETYEEAKKILKESSEKKL